VAIREALRATTDKQKAGGPTAAGATVNMIIYKYTHTHNMCIYIYIFIYIQPTMAIREALRARAVAKRAGGGNGANDYLYTHI